MDKKVPLRARIEKSKNDKLEKIAARLNIKKSEAVRRAIADYIDKNES